MTSPLTRLSLSQASITSGIAALMAEQRKHAPRNDPKCHTLGWTCIPLAVQCYGNWGSEARQTSRLASCLSLSLPDPKSKILMDLYGKLNRTLGRTQGHY